MPSETLKQDRASLLRDKNLWLIFAVTMVSVMGISPIAPAFPEIAQHFHVPESEAGLLITFYTFGGIALSIFEGVIADRFGRKVILVPSLMLLGIGSALCTTAGSFETLLLWRGIQSIGGAALPFMYSTILGDLYQGKKRTQAVGYTGSALSMGLMFYPLIGGALALAGWYWPFYMALAAVVVAVAALFWLDTPRPEQKRPLGQYLRESWKGIRQPGRAWLYLCYGMSSFLFFGVWLTHFSFRMRTSFGASTLEIGGMFSIAALTVAITSSQLRSLREWIGRRNLVTYSYLLFVLGFGIIPVIHNQWLMIAPAVVTGLAWGANTPSVRDLLSGSAELANRGIYLAIIAFSLRTGQAAGPAVEDSVLGAWGLSAVFYFGAAVALVMFAVAFFTVRRGGKRGTNQTA